MISTLSFSTLTSAQFAALTSAEFAALPTLNSTATEAESALYELIVSDAGVAAIAGTKVHPTNEPQSVGYPKVTYSRWGSDRSSDVGGFTNDGPTGYAVGKFFVDCLAPDALTAKKLASAVRRAINGFRGPVGTVQIGSIRVDDEREQPGALIAGTNTPIQRRTLDVRITYLEI